MTNEEFCKKHAFLYEVQECNGDTGTVRTHFNGLWCENNGRYELSIKTPSIDGTLYLEDRPDSRYKWRPIAFMTTKTHSDFCTAYYVATEGEDIGKDIMCAVSKLGLTPEQVLNYAKAYLYAARDNEDVNLLAGLNDWLWKNYPTEKWHEYI